LGGSLEWVWHIRVTCAAYEANEFKSEILTLKRDSFGDIRVL